MYMRNAMLSQVKDAIKSLKNDTFHEHFAHYVMEMQDATIQEELRFFRRSNSDITPKGLIAVVNDLCEGMNN